MTMRRISILGATGSIGDSTLDVIARHPDRFAVAALTAHGQWEKLALLCRRFRPEVAALSDPAAAVLLERALAGHGLPTRVLSGAEGLVEAAAMFASDVLNPRGTFLAKVFQSGAEAELLAQLKRDFVSVRHVKPASSRQDSSERYVLAMGFRGQPSR